MKGLLVIDMLRDFVNKNGALYVGAEGEEIIPFVREKVREFKEEGAPVFFIADNHEHDDSEFAVFPPHCVAETPGAAIADSVGYEAGDRVIPKRRYSAFFGTGLDISLREKDVDELHLVGVCTNICVLYTAADGRNLGYRVVIHKDAVASFDGEAHDFALKEAEKTLGCRVV